MPDLSLVDHVRLGKHRAAGGDLAGVLGGEGHLPQILHGDAQPLGLGGEEGPRARGAEGVHGVIGDDALLQEDDFGVLPADFNDGADARVPQKGAPRVGGDFILHRVGLQHGADEPSGGAGGAHRADLHGRGQLSLQGGDDFFGGGDGVALRPQVFGGEDPALVVNHHPFGGDGTDIHAQAS